MSTTPDNTTPAAEPQVSVPVSFIAETAAFTKQAAEQLDAAEQASKKYAEVIPGLVDKMIAAGLVDSADRDRSVSELQSSPTKCAEAMERLLPALAPPPSLGAPSPAAPVPTGSVKSAADSHWENTLRG